MEARKVIDIRKEPYAQWLEETLQSLAESKPQTIGMVAIMPDGTTGTTYYNMDNRDRLVMCEAIMIDYFEQFIRVNADYIKSILNGEEPDEEEE